MVKEMYNKPEFGFQEMALFERVAAVCWGTSQVWLDLNGDNAINSIDLQITTSGGCQGSWSADAINTNVSAFNTVVGNFNSLMEDGKQDDAYAALRGYNSNLADWAIAQGDDVRLKPITATATSNWANTQATSGGGIIIVGSGSKK